jgi:integrase
MIPGGRENERQKRRRGRNEGSIRRREDGRWQATMSLGWRNGRRWRKFIYGDTREDVAKELNRALKAQQDSLPVVGGRQTFEQFLDAWLENAVKGKVRPLTFESYVSYVTTHLKPGLGKKTLARLSSQEVQGFLNAKSAEKDENNGPRYAPRTVQYMHAVLRRALGQAERWGLVARNVAKLVEAPRIVRKRSSRSPRTTPRGFSRLPRVSASRPSSRSHSLSFYVRQRRSGFAARALTSKPAA